MPIDQPNQAMDAMNPEGQNTGAGGFCIDIYVSPDGTFTVTREEKPAPQDKGGQTADNIGDALKLALDIFEQGESATADEQFDQGFGVKPKSAMGANPGMPKNMY